MEAGEREPTYNIFTNVKNLISVNYNFIVYEKGTIFTIRRRRDDTKVNISCIQYSNEINEIPEIISIVSSQTDLGTL